jgi:predicted RNase H-like HicB family nuclease
METQVIERPALVSDEPRKALSKAVPEAHPKALPDDVLEVKRCETCGEIMFLTPMLKCSHCGQIYRLHCHSYKQGEGFYAECLNLNLLARGNTQEEAVARLQEQMFTYVDAALSGDVQGLIPRQAPLASWIGYYAHRIKNFVIRLFSRHSHNQDLEFQDIGVSISSHC